MNARGVLKTSSSRSYAVRTHLHRRVVLGSHSLVVRMIACHALDAGSIPAGSVFSTRNNNKVLRLTHTFLYSLTYSKTMRWILFELACRVLYIVLVKLAIECCFYLSFGFQYEYACVFCQCHNQSIDFCFQSVYEPYDNPYISNISTSAFTRVPTCIVSPNESILRDELINLCHQSKSWGLLGLSCASYMHAHVHDSTLLLNFYKSRIILLVVGLQLYGFMLPGVNTQLRLRWYSVAHIVILLIVLCSILIAPLDAIVAEFQIEPVDSELISYHRANF